MHYILSISFRNFIRQKRRNILLGIAIAFGALVLVLANAFSHGITKVMFEQIVKYTNGHVAVSYMRGGNMMNQVFHDDVLIREAVKKNSPPDARIEEAIGVFGRAIGNGVADNVILVGVDIKGQLTEQERREFEANFKMIEGSFEALENKTGGYPVVLAEQKAKYLKVKMGDIVRVRFTGVTNQTSSAQLTVVGIFKPANLFMSTPVFLEAGDLRGLAGYGPHDIPTLQINMKNPQANAKKTADRIHDALKPGLAVLPATVYFRSDTTRLAALCFRTDSASKVLMSKNIKLAYGDSAGAFGYAGVILPNKVATRLGVSCGDTIRLAWKGKYDTTRATAKLKVTALADSTAPIPENTFLVNERDFYRNYYSPLPSQYDAAFQKLLPDSTHPLWPALGPEFILMKRCANTQEFTTMSKEMARAKFKGIMVNVQSMYETASAILNIELVLNLIMLVAGMVLFFIIMIGVINTLRMTIRERTREIGTVRAIGMQKGDVRSIFMMETGILALFASLAGTILAFCAMWGLSSITIDAGDNPMGMLLVQGHLHFAPTVFATIGYVVLIVGIAVLTAYFPARRAAKLSAAEALRHFE